jgi:hypothetical protein
MVTEAASGIGAGIAARFVSAASAACNSTVTIMAMSPPRVEICPRLIAGSKIEPTILKCCVWEFDIERHGNVMIVPWGANLSMIERALRELSQDFARL